MLITQVTRQLQNVFHNVFSKDRGACIAKIIFPIVGNGAPGIAVIQAYAVCLPTVAGGMPVKVCQRTGIESQPETHIVVVQFRCRFADDTRRLDACRFVEGLQPCGADAVLECVFHLRNGICDDGREIQFLSFVNHRAVGALHQHTLMIGVSVFLGVGKREVAGGK